MDIFFLDDYRSFVRWKRRCNQNLAVGLSFRRLRSRAVLIDNELASTVTNSWVLTIVLSMSCNSAKYRTKMIPIGGEGWLGAKKRLFMYTLWRWYIILLYQHAFKCKETLAKLEICFADLSCWIPIKRQSWCRLNIGGILRNLSWWRRGPR